MQAHPLSTPAAWNTSFSPALPESATSNNTSVSEGPGLAHDAGNLLGALSLYCDLLDVPGVLRRHASVPGDPVVTIRLELQEAAPENLRETTPDEPRFLALTIADNAGGMTTSTAADFLKPAPLPPASKRGLGHRIVHELLESTHGNLYIHVVNGRSTTLCIKWPLARFDLAPGTEGDSAC